VKKTLKISGKHSVEARDCTDYKSSEESARASTSLSSRGAEEQAQTFNQASGEFLLR